jgi:uncharacterized protein YdcH (DUF465 family)
MLGEHHDIEHEFPEFQDRIVELKRINPAFLALMKEHDQLDNYFRRLSDHQPPVADLYIEDLKKKRAFLKDRVYEMLR